MRRLLPILIGIVLAVPGCAIDTKIPESEKNKVLLPPQNKNVFSSTPQGSYLRIVDPNRVAMEKRVQSFRAQTQSVQDVLQELFPTANVTVADRGVDLRKLVNVDTTGMTVADLIRHLEGVTGYEIQLVENAFTIRSFVSKQWNLAELASQRVAKASVGQNASGSASATTLTLGSTQDDDTWKTLLSTAKSILGVSDVETGAIPLDSTVGGAPGAAGTPGSLGLPSQGVGGSTTGMPSTLDMGLGAAGTPQPYVVGIRALGQMTAAGPADKMRRLSAYIEQVKRQASAQVNISVKAWDVTLNDDRKRGIDWSLLANSIFDGAPITASLAGSSALPTTAASVWTVGAGYTGKRITADAVFQFLSQFGNVELINEPNVTTINGATAYISAGNEFSYIANLNVQTTTSDTGAQMTTTTPSFERLKVGVTMAVTPRLLDDDRILIEVVPVVTSLQGWDNFDFQGNPFQTPNIALQELSTQVITRSGEPIQLGGLISNKVAESLSRVPFKDDSGGIFNFLFSSEANLLERRELVITLTPTVVRSGAWTVSKN